MHPVTLGALGVLLVNDLMFKALWPGAWVPGKLSDLAWMMFAPPVLAFVLSFATTGQRLKAQRAVFAATYAGLPLLYVAFNTFEPVHDAMVLLVLGLGWRGRTSFAPGPDGLDRHPRCDGRRHLGMAQAVLGCAEPTHPPRAPGGNGCRSGKRGQYLR